jgi:serine/threonine protein phosphatase PrpC
MITTIEDCFFTSAEKPKKNCQDYALSGHDPIPYLIICDGCSSSRYTDIGARIIAHKTKAVISEIFSKEFPDVRLSSFSECDDFYEYIGKSIIFQSKQATSGIIQECLDSTLIIAFVYDNYVYVFMYGDGFIIYNHKIDGLNLISTEFEGNAPFYLSYLSNINLLDSYKDFAFKYPEMKTLTINYFQMDLDPNKKKDIKCKFNHPIIQKIPIKDLSLLMIASDGIASFTDHKNESIDLQQLIRDITSIKSKSGEFIQRKMLNKILPQLTAENILNYDDVSIGAFLFDEEANG